MSTRPPDVPTMPDERVRAARRGLIGALLITLAGACASDREVHQGDGGACSCSSAGRFECVDTQSIRSCDGCAWKTHTCDDLCKINKGATWAMDPQKGCQLDSATGGEICWCKEKVTGAMCDITWTFTDACDDGKSPKVGFYDLQEKTTSGPYTLPAYNTPLKTTIKCKCGGKICYGAWLGTTYWGCGESCSKACNDCCIPCQDGGTSTTTLNC